MLSEKMVSAYLERIGFAGFDGPDACTLDALVRQHQCAVPFETVMLHRTGKPPSLDLEVLFDKVVTKRLGGYCFELNKLFEALLVALGFNARAALCRSASEREERMPINHRGVIVELGGFLHLADVGYGGPVPAGALRLEHACDQVIDGSLFTPYRMSDAWWRIERLTRARKDFFDDDIPSRRQVEIEVCTAIVEDQDFEPLNLFFSQPGMLFRDHEIANLHTPGGYLGLMDGVLTRREGGEKETVSLGRRANVDAALLEVFGMDVSLWVQGNK